MSMKDGQVFAILRWAYLLNKFSHSPVRYHIKIRSRIVYAAALLEERNVP